MSKKATVFYSYAHLDSTMFRMFVSGFRAYVTRQDVSLDDWFDEAIGISRVWRGEISSEIENRDNIIVFLTKNSFVRSRELRSEMEKEVKFAQRKGKQIITILFEMDIEMPNYLASIQAINAYEESGDFNNIYKKIFDVILSPPVINNKRKKHNLYIASLGRQSGQTSLIIALDQLLIDGYHHSGYFKPFRLKDYESYDAASIIELFELSNLGITVENVTPFEYGARLPNCTEEDLKIAFDYVARRQSPVAIEGTLFPPRNITLRQLIVDIFDARLLLVINHEYVDDLAFPAETLEEIAEQLDGESYAFVFNKVPAEGLSTVAQDLRSIALNLKFKELGTIPFDARLCAIKVQDLVNSGEWKLLGQADPSDASVLEKVILEVGQTNFSDEKAIQYYSSKLPDEREGFAVFSSPSKLGLNMSLIDDGYTLLLVGLESEPQIHNSLIQYANSGDEKKAILYFTGASHEAANSLERIQQQVKQSGMACDEKKREHFSRLVSDKLDEDTLEIVLKRN